jgi:hypothetical protein
MILIVAIIFGLAATIVRARLLHRTLTLQELRWEWLVFAMVIPQALVFQIPAIGRWIPEAVIPGLQIVTMLGLLVFAARNLLAPGFWALALGLLSNFVVIALNGGWMPISPETIHRLVPGQTMETWEVGTRFGLTKDRIMAVSDTNLAFLSDFITVPTWFPYKVAFSIGDIFISVGAFLLLWSLSSTEKEKK